jgi:hypothetical protein
LGRKRNAIKETRDIYRNILNVGCLVIFLKAKGIKKIKYSRYPITSIGIPSKVFVSSGMLLFVILNIAYQRLKAPLVIYCSSPPEKSIKNLIIHMRGLFDIGKVRNNIITAIIGIYASKRYFLVSSLKYEVMYRGRSGSSESFVNNDRL